MLAATWPKLPEEVKASILAMVRVVPAVVAYHHVGVERIAFPASTTMAIDRVRFRLYRKYRLFPLGNSGEMTS